ncbi:hypothetical protein GGF37_003390 [Kickxella alabastrina]|nr:hypothetical protein GGF37_003390 [Kickxella alabastrina]
MARAEATYFRYALDSAKMQHSKAMVHAVVELINNAGKALQEAKANHAKCLEVVEDQVRRVVDQAAKDKLELQAEIIQIRDNIDGVKDKMAAAVHGALEAFALALNGSAATLIQPETAEVNTDDSFLFFDWPGVKPSKK